VGIFDLALLDLRMLVEFDGPEHDSPKYVEEDRLRDQRAKTAGWDVTRIPVPRNQVIEADVLHDLLGDELP